MKAIVTDDGKLQIDIDDLFCQISKERSSRPLQALACNDQIITNVMEMVLEGFTEDGYRGYMGGTTAEPVIPLDIFRREIARLSPGIAKKEIENLENALSEAQDEASRLHLIIYRLERQLGRWVETSSN